jgi:hypothetical protein
MSGFDRTKQRIEPEPRVSVSAVPGSSDVGRSRRPPSGSGR